MKQNKKVQKWCALFAKIPVPLSLMIAILQNANADAESIIWEYLHRSWLPPRGANLQTLRELMPYIRKNLPSWKLDEETLLALCGPKETTELLKLYIIYRAALPESVLEKLKEHPQKEEIFRLCDDWMKPLKTV